MTHAAPFRKPDFLMPLLKILDTGPYRYDLKDDSTLIQQNLDAITDASLRLFRVGPLLVIGEG